MKTPKRPKYKIGDIVVYRVNNSPFLQQAEVIGGMIHPKKSNFWSYFINGTLLGTKGTLIHQTDILYKL